MISPYGNTAKNIIINLSLWPYLVISLMVSICYIPTFSGEFMLDDRPFIEKNPFIRQTPTLASLVIQEDGIVDRTEAGSYHTGYYRPLINLSYWVDYKIWGMKAPGFRTTNLRLHLLTSFLIFQFLMLFVRDRNAALLTTLLFSLHPVNTESVSQAVCRNNILVTLLALSSLFYYVKAWERSNNSKMILSIFFYVLAVFSKEFGLMLLPVFFLYHRLAAIKKDIIKEGFTYLPFILTSILYFILRDSVTGSLLTPSNISGLW